METQPELQELIPPPIFKQPGAPWTAEEDLLLLQHVAKYGTRHWASLQSSGRLPHRDQKACCNRFILLRKRFFSRHPRSTSRGAPIAAAPRQVVTSSESLPTSITSSSDAAAVAAAMIAPATDSPSRCNSAALLTRGNQPPSTTEHAANPLSILFPPHRISSSTMMTTPPSLAGSSYLGLSQPMHSLHRERHVSLGNTFEAVTTSPFPSTFVTSQQAVPWHVNAHKPGGNVPPASSHRNENLQCHPLYERLYQPFGRVHDQADGGMAEMDSASHGGTMDQKGSFSAPAHVPDGLRGGCWGGVEQGEEKHDRNSGNEMLHYLNNGTDNTSSSICSSVAMGRSSQPEMQRNIPSYLVLAPSRNDASGMDGSQGGSESKACLATHLCKKVLGMVARRSRHADVEDEGADVDDSANVEAAEASLPSLGDVKEEPRELEEVRGSSCMHGVAQAAVVTSAAAVTPAAAVAAAAVVTTADQPTTPNAGLADDESDRQRAVGITEQVVPQNRRTASDGLAGQLCVPASAATTKICGRQSGQVVTAGGDVTAPEIPSSATAATKDAAVVAAVVVDAGGSGNVVTVPPAVTTAEVGPSRHSLAPSPSNGAGLVDSRDNDAILNSTSGVAARKLAWSMLASCEPRHAGNSAAVTPHASVQSALLPSQSVDASVSDRSTSDAVTAQPISHPAATTVETVETASPPPQTQPAMAHSMPHTSSLSEQWERGKFGGKYAPFPTSAAPEGVWSMTRGGHYGYTSVVRFDQSMDPIGSYAASRAATSSHLQPRAHPASLRNTSPPPPWSVAVPRHRNKRAIDTLFLQESEQIGALASERNAAATVTGEGSGRGGGGGEYRNASGSGKVMNECALVATSEEIELNRRLAAYQEDTREVPESGCLRSKVPDYSQGRICKRPRADLASNHPTRTPAAHTALNSLLGPRHIETPPCSVPAMSCSGGGCSLSASISENCRLTSQVVNSRGPSPLGQEASRQEGAEGGGIWGAEWGYSGEQYTSCTGNALDAPAAPSAAAGATSATAPHAPAAPDDACYTVSSMGNFSSSTTQMAAHSLSLAQQPPSSDAEWIGGWQPGSVAVGEGAHHDLQSEDSLQQRVRLAREDALELEMALYRSKMLSKAFLEEVACIEKLLFPGRT